MLKLLFILIFHIVFTERIILTILPIAATMSYSATMPIMAIHLIGRCRQLVDIHSGLFRLFRKTKKSEIPRKCSNGTCRIIFSWQGKIFFLVFRIMKLIMKCSTGQSRDIGCTVFRAEQQHRTLLYLTHRVFFFPYYHIVLENAKSSEHVLPNVSFCHEEGSALTHLSIQID